MRRDRYVPTRRRVLGAWVPCLRLRLAFASDEPVIGLLSRFQDKQDDATAFRRQAQDLLRSLGPARRGA
jgi:hypothetical protein